MNIVIEHGSSEKVPAGTAARAGIPAALSILKRLLVATVLFSCAYGVKAALIEMPPLGGGGVHAKQDAAQYPFSWYSATHHAAQGMLGSATANANRPAWRAYPANGVARPHDAGAHVLRTANGGAIADSDLYAAIDTPYGMFNGTTPLAGDTDPELWTILLIAAGLIGYQLRRKSRIGAIRVRPMKL